MIQFVSEKTAIHLILLYTLTVFGLLTYSADFGTSLSHLASHKAKKRNKEKFKSNLDLEAVQRSLTLDNLRS